MSQSQINLNDIANNQNLSLSITSNAEENPKDACIRRTKDVVLFSIAIVFVLSAFIFCGYVILSKNFSSNDKKWALTIASSIISAFLGFLTGKNIG